ncbi:accessory gland protein Acp29AB-like [Drosophila ficusphila]|uniref:accessory gland protein Acp29AB-like n=1 Tax=Drosophila ficusphila TaxID=30025 RepID=UPI0007E80F88|nr:accessory gland protein Acp29AB-like [Drosophila ficusphila]
MWRYCYFLWLFTVCGLWGSQAKNQEKCSVHEIATNQQKWFGYTAENQAETHAKIDKLKAELEGQLQALQVNTELQQQTLKDVMESQKGVIKPKINKMKDEMEGQLQALQKKTEILLQELREIALTQKAVVEPKPSQKVSQTRSKLFEKIGSRYFYLEKNLSVNWFDAFHRCRQMGGYLATINDEKEFKLIDSTRPYWFDITSLANTKTQISTRTGKPPPYTKWHKFHPRTNVYICAAFNNVLMWSHNCYDEFSFICQSDQ